MRISLFHLFLAASLTLAVPSVRAANGGSTEEAIELEPYVSQLPKEKLVVVRTNDGALLVLLQSDHPAEKRIATVGLFFGDEVPGLIQAAKASGKVVIERTDVDAKTLAGAKPVGRGPAGESGWTELQRTINQN